jgi:hypothetical protein
VVVVVAAVVVVVVVPPAQGVDPAAARAASEVLLYLKYSLELDGPVVISDGIDAAVNGPLTEGAS